MAGTNAKLFKLLIFGFFLFGQVPEIWLIPGAILIIGGSYYSLWSEARQRRAESGR